MRTDPWKRLQDRVKAAAQRVGPMRDEANWLRTSRSITELMKLRAAIDDLIDEEVIRGHESGAPWAALGTGRQQAQQRYVRAMRRRGRSSLARRGVEGDGVI
jgi:hypothetical protein